jgi:CheY-like chemotaxis protein
MKICKSILLVEDDDDIREQITEILSEEGYQVEAAENGKIALDYLKACSAEHLPGCMILDLMMPVMTGKQLMEITLQDPLFKHIPIIVASAKGSPSEDLLNIQGYVEKIKKPMDIEELFRVVETYCGKPAGP